MKTFLMRKIYIRKPFSLSAFFYVQTESRDARTFSSTSIHEKIKTINNFAFWCNLKHLRPTVYLIETS